MRAAFFVVLLVANGALWWSSNEAVRERAVLESRASVLGDRASRARDRARDRDQLAALLRGFDQRMDGPSSREPLDIASLREKLLAAESGLSLDRISLDFRPLSTPASASAATGSRIQASVRGRFTAIETYLSRLETSGLPLSPEELRLRRDTSGMLALEARWNAVWNVPDEALSSDELAALERWLPRERGLLLERDLFSDAQPTLAPDSGAPRPAPSREAAPLVLPPDGDAAFSQGRESLPALTGFVLARPELEPDVDRRVLAALRFEGEIHLVQVGEGLGDYELTAVAALESVTLVHATTGARVVLTLP